MLLVRDREARYQKRYICHKCLLSPIKKKKKPQDWPARFPYAQTLVAVQLIKSCKTFIRRRREEKKREEKKIK